MTSINPARVEAATEVAQALANQGVDRLTAYQSLLTVTLNQPLSQAAVEAVYDVEQAPEPMTPEQFAQALTEKFADQEYSSNVFKVDNVGPKYTRISQEREGDMYSKSVHCFIDNATGAVLKSAGWKTPAKYVRYATMEAALEAADVHGSYLYKR